MENCRLALKSWIPRTSRAIKCLQEIQMWPFGLTHNTVHFTSKSLRCYCLLSGIFDKQMSFFFLFIIRRWVFVMILVGGNGVQCADVSKTRLMDKIIKPEQAINKSSWQDASVLFCFNGGWRTELIKSVVCKLSWRNSECWYHFFYRL